MGSRSTASAQNGVPWPTGAGQGRAGESPAAGSPAGLFVPAAPSEGATLPIIASFSPSRSPRPSPPMFVSGGRTSMLPADANGSPRVPCPDPAAHGWRRSPWRLRVLGPQGGSPGRVPWEGPSARRQGRRPSPRAPETGSGARFRARDTVTVTSTSSCFASSAK